MEERKPVKVSFEGKRTGMGGETVYTLVLLTIGKAAIVIALLIITLLFALTFAYGASNIFSVPGQDLIENPLQGTKITVANVNNQAGWFSGKPVMEIGLSKDEFLNKGFNEVFVSSEGDKLIFWGFDPIISYPFRWTMTPTNHPFNIVIIKDITLTGNSIGISYERDWFNTVGVFVTFGSLVILFGILSYIAYKHFFD